MFSKIKLMFYGIFLKDQIIFIETSPVKIFWLKVSCFKLNQSVTRNFEKLMINGRSSTNFEINLVKYTLDYLDKHLACDHMDDLR